MQNTGTAQIAASTPSSIGAVFDGRSAASTRRFMRTAPLLIACALFCACVAVLLAPGTASARDYTMPDTSIQATVTAAGDLHVVETRHFSFDGSYSAVWWTFKNLPEGASLQVNGVSARQGSSASVASASLATYSEVPFQTKWRDSGSPGAHNYSVDTAKNTTYVFFDADSEDLLVTFDYTIVNGAVAYQDVADLYWQYVTSDWAVDSQNVTCTITLPVPAGTEVLKGDNVRAWGHGSLDGTVAFNADGTITYKSPNVASGSYAEARIVFPTSWLTGLRSEATGHTGESHLSSVLSEEQAWADKANAQRTSALIFVISCLVISLALILWGVLTFRKWGREYKPEFQDKYWRDVPEKGCHPAVVARNKYWNANRQEDFTATLMHLCAQGAITISKGSYEKQGMFKTKQVDDYFLTKVPDMADAVTDPIDRKTLDLLFDTIAEGKDALWFATIQEYGKDNPEDFTVEMAAWQGVVTAAVNKADLFDAKSAKKQALMRAVAAIALIAFFAAGFFVENFIPPLCAVVVAVVLLLLAHNTSRRTRRGCELNAYSTALSNWLKDFTRLKENVPTDVKVWGELMVYAYQFGIAEQVLKDLKTQVPELFEYDDTAAGIYYVPWWVWYSSSFSGMPAAGNMFDTALTNTFDTAKAAMSGASGGFSSGGGFGGGFSMGGGGGFGGGGGAR